MSMSKKDFIVLADKVKEHNKLVSMGVGGLQAFTSDQLNTLAAVCAYGNPAFKRDRWMDYIAGECGPNGGAIGKIRISSRP